MLSKRNLTGYSKKEIADRHSTHCDEKVEHKGVAEPQTAPTPVTITTTFTQCLESCSLPAKATAEECRSQREEERRSALPLSSLRSHFPDSSRSSWHPVGFSIAAHASLRR